MYANPSLNFKITHRIATIFLCEVALYVKWDHMICQNPQLHDCKIRMRVAAVRGFSLPSR
jgi:hypothetical protein